MDSTSAARRLLSLLTVERIAYIGGTVVLAAWALIRITGALGAHADLARFGEQTVAAQSLDALTPAAEPDLALWDIERIKAWRAELSRPAPAPYAVLRIPKIHLEAAVLPGTDDATLNRGLGHIEDTALPGTEGNSGIAGHRDGFFRGLKDVSPGDLIELQTRDGRQTYRIERTWIVDPDDVSVLDPTPAQALTLVTCYPFYFVGPAPQRFIVRAVRANSPSTTPGN